MALHVVGLCWRWGQDHESAEFGVPGISGVWYARGDFEMFGIRFVSHHREVNMGGTSDLKKKAAVKVVVENVNVPGHTSRVDGAKYAAMKAALWKVLPKKAPGMTQAEMGAAVLEHLPEDLFPGGKTALWWVKTVQLDLEAKGQIVRVLKPKPTRWHR